MKQVGCHNDSKVFSEVIKFCDLVVCSSSSSLSDWVNCSSFFTCWEVFISFFSSSVLVSWNKISLENNDATTATGVLSVYLISCCKFWSFNSLQLSW